MPRRHEPLGVTRIEIPERYTRGWMARIARGDERRNEFFSDGEYGSSRLAKEAAIRQVRRWRAELPPPRTSHQGVVTTRNKSGEVNIYARAHNPEGKPQLEYQAWVGTWRGKGGRKATKAFSWNKYSAAGAKKLARIARDLRTQDMSAIFTEYRARHGRVPARWES